METTNDDNSIAVIWYDGSQECKVLNVFPREYNSDTANDTIISDSCVNHILDEKVCDDIHNGINNNELISRGIDNAAFDENTVESDRAIDLIGQSTSSCSSSGTPGSSSSGRTSNTPSSEQKSCKTSIKRTSRCSSTRSSIRSTSSSNVHFSHSNPAFEMPNELSYDAVVKHSPIHPNVYLVRKRNSITESHRPTSCTCPSNDVIIQVRPTELVDDVACSVVTNDNDASDYKLNFIKRGIISPVKTKSICNVHHTDISSITNIKRDRDGDDPPPNYSSLRFMFLEDEPPKYQDVTGKKLTMGDAPKLYQATTAKWKRRAIVFAVILFIILIGALLVYACFVSGHPLGAYGTVPRKF